MLHSNVLCGGLPQKAGYPGGGFNKYDMEAGIGGDFKIMEVRKIIPKKNSNIVLKSIQE